MKRFFAFLPVFLTLLVCFTGPCHYIKKAEVLGGAEQADASEITFVTVAGNEIPDDAESLDLEGSSKHDRCFAMIDMYRKRNCISEDFSKYDGMGQREPANRGQRTCSGDMI